MIGEFERCAEPAHGLIQVFGRIVPWRRGAPNGTWPGWITLESGDNMDMKLFHHIAQRAYVDFVGVVEIFQGGGAPRGLGHGLGLIRGGQVVQVLEPWAHWNQDQPRIIGVSHEKDAAKRQRRDFNRVRGQGLVQFEQALSPYFEPA